MRRDPIPQLSSRPMDDALETTTRLYMIDSCGAGQQYCCSLMTDNTQLWSKLWLDHHHHHEQSRVQAELYPEMSSSELSYD